MTGLIKISNSESGYFSLSAYSGVKEIAFLSERMGYILVRTSAIIQSQCNHVGAEDSKLGCGSNQDEFRIGNERREVGHGSNAQEYEWPEAEWY